MKKRILDRQLQNKVNNYLLYANQIELSHIDLLAIEIINSLPETIRNEIYIDHHKNIMQNWKVFT
jgi:hypothetical protein